MDGKRYKQVGVLIALALPLLISVIAIINQPNAASAGAPIVSPSSPPSQGSTANPNYTRKLPPSVDSITPVAPDPNYRPLVCSAPVVNVSQTTGNHAESFVVVNPTNPNNIVAFSNPASGSGIFRAYSFDGGTNWTRGTAVANACCDGQAAFDSFGNLFLVYINATVNQILVALSTDGGVTFGAGVAVGNGSVDQPSIAVGSGSVWVDWNLSGSMVARGAPVTGLGVWGPFGAQQAIPSATGSFGGITVGPGANGGKVMVTYQSPTSGQGPATIYVNVDADGLGAGGFGARITATGTNVGGFDFIPAQSSRSVDSEAGLVWDATGGPFNDRVYLVYTEEPVNENNDTEIYLRTSTNDGATWSAAVRVNDDATTRSQFLPYIALDRTTGTVAIGWHDSHNDNGVPGTGGTNAVANDDAEYYASYSTNGGATWAANTRLSGGFSNDNAAANGVDYGDYVGTAGAYGGRFVAVWADNANCDGTNPNGTLSRFDLYMGSMTLPGGPTPTVTSTSTATRTATFTFTPTATSTSTATRTATNTPTNTLTSTATDTPTDTPTSTATDTPTNTPTDTPTTNIPTDTPTGTSTSTPTLGGVIIGHVTWQGPPAQPSALQQLPITLTLKSGTTEVNYPVQNTDSSGFFTQVVALPDGAYDWRVKGPDGVIKTLPTDPPGYLANSGTLALTGGATTQVEMGLMRAGDCNNDNVVSLADFNILRNTFGRSVGDPLYDARSDFTGDQTISISDFNLLRGNFGGAGAPPLGPMTGK